jgi:hypothetical protein
MVTPKDCCKSYEAINSKYINFWNDKSPENCADFKCKMVQTIESPEATCLKGKCLVHSASAKKMLEAVVNPDWNITDKSDLYSVPLGAISDKNCLAYEVSNPNETYLQEHGGGYFNYSAFHRFWFCPNDWNGKFKEIGLTEQVYNAQFLGNFSRYKVYHYSMGNNSDQMLPQKLILSAGNPTDKEKLLDSVINDLVKCNAEKYDYDSNSSIPPRCLDRITPLIPQVIDAIQDTTPLERHDDTGWGFIHNQAMTTMRWYALIVDGVDRAEDSRFSFFKSGGMPTGEEIYSVHYNWLEWWEENNPEKCLQQGLLDFDKYAQASHLPVTENEDSLCHYWFEQENLSPKWAIGKIMKIDLEGRQIDTNTKLYTFVLLGKARAENVTIPIKISELENYYVGKYIKVDMLNICRSIEMLVSSQNEPPIAKNFTPSQEINCS